MELTQEKLIEYIPVGQDNAIDMALLLKKFGVELTVGDKDAFSFKRRMARYLESIQDYTDELKKLKQGRGNAFYWTTLAQKSEFLSEKFKPSMKSIGENRSLALNMIENHLYDFLPPSVKSELSDDFDRAANYLSKNTTRNNWQAKLNFHPSGYPLINNANDEFYNEIYSALESERVISIKYDSIHKSISNTLTISPQQLQYQNHQLLLLAYIHETSQLKYFEVPRILNFSIVTDKNMFYKKQNLDDWKVTLPFKAHVHTWVKNYFDNVSLGNNQLYTQHSKETWIIEADITIPKHFKHNDPDPFFFANMLGMFADAMEVLEPECLRKEMIRRARQHQSLYLCEGDSTDVLTRSPHETSVK
ncbi:WYL domain-containing protein [Colwellia sp. BRX8-9]|uniref:WYL domain-containing protein n=1 Tax=Colwellia sp. BRX8-9 TaxID=2759831 RepID=UPI0015F59584|nr:WYL domain-containing protein [Colwellia sp. BRX8-9]MBA6350171.1 WYL domain-containing protein [Colwellia sp. BRX8-9]